MCRLYKQVCFSESPEIDSFSLLLSIICGSGIEATISPKGIMRIITTLIEVTPFFFFFFSCERSINWQPSHSIGHLNEWCQTDRARAASGLQTGLTPMQ